MASRKADRLADQGKARSVSFDQRIRARAASEQILLFARFFHFIRLLNFSMSVRCSTGIYYLRRISLAIPYESASSLTGELGIFAAHPCGSIAAVELCRVRMKMFSNSAPIIITRLLSRTAVKLLFTRPMTVVLARYMLSEPKMNS